MKEFEPVSMGSYSKWRRMMYRAGRSCERMKADWDSPTLYNMPASLLTTMAEDYIECDPEFKLTIARWVVRVLLGLEHIGGLMT